MVKFYGGRGFNYSTSKQVNIFGVRKYLADQHLFAVLLYKKTLGLFFASDFFPCKENMGLYVHTNH